MKTITLLTALLLISFSNLNSQPTTTLSFLDLNAEPGNITVNVSVDEISSDILIGQWYCIFDPDHLEYVNTIYPHPNFPTPEWVAGINAAGNEMGCNWLPGDFVAESINPGETLFAVEFVWDGECTELSWGVTPKGFNAEKGETRMWNDDLDDYELTLFNGSVCNDVEPPQNLTAEIMNINDVQLNWDAPDNKNLLGYNVYRNDQYVNLSEETDYIDENLDNGDFTYCIKALYDGGESECSDEAEVSIFFAYPPTNLTATVVDTNNFSLNWTMPEYVGFTGISIIYRNGDMIANIPGNSYMDINLADGNYTYCVTALYDIEESGCSNEVIVEVNTLDIEEIYLNKTSIYPNPTINVINIISEDRIFNIMVYNFKGQLVYEGSVNDKFRSIDISNYESGVYIFRIETEQGLLNRKVIIQ